MHVPRAARGTRFASRYTFSYFFFFSSRSREKRERKPRCEGEKWNAEDDRNERYPGETNKFRQIAPIIAGVAGVRNASRYPDGRRNGILRFLYARSSRYFFTTNFFISYLPEPRRVLYFQLPGHGFLYYYDIRDVTSGRMDARTTHTSRYHWVPLVCRSLPMTTGLAYIILMPII